MRRMLFGAAATAVCVAGLAAAQAPAPAAPAQAAAEKTRPTGYLKPNEIFDASAFLPPYPAKGSAAEAYDIAAWRESLKQADSERWKRAASDDDVGLKEGVKQFECAIGARLTKENAPALMELLLKTQFDVAPAVDKAKDRFKRARPFADDPAAPTCLPIPPESRSKVSTAYPSGHSTLGMAWGLILAELAPDRAGPIMSRVRDFSESRLVCGIHFPSDLEAGHTTGAALVARLHAEPAFRADLDKARAEVAAARTAQTAPPQGCAAA